MLSVTCVSMEVFGIYSSHLRPESSGERLRASDHIYWSSMLVLFEIKWVHNTNFFTHKLRLMIEWSYASERWSSNGKRLYSTAPSTSKRWAIEMQKTQYNTFVPMLTYVIIEFVIMILLWIKFWKLFIFFVSM